MLNGLGQTRQGRITMQGRVALIRLGAGFNPILTRAGEYLHRSNALGFSQREIDGEV
jgi:ABC-type polysaccharide/polyol phosphate transport system ATPase subunit